MTYKCSVNIGSSKSFSCVVYTCTNLSPGQARKIFTLKRAHHTVLVNFVRPVGESILTSIFALEAKMNSVSKAQAVVEEPVDLNSLQALPSRQSCQ